jgi:hypothetical protein
LLVEETFKQSSRPPPGDGSESKERPELGYHTIEYGWADTYLSDGVAYGIERLEEQGGASIRPTRARILFRELADARRFL